MRSKKNGPYIAILLTGLGLMCSDIHASAQPVIGDFFQVTESSTKMLISLFFMGAFFASLIAGILSDIYGRRPCILFSLLLMLGGALITCFSDSFQFFLVARFLQGLSTGSMSVIAFAIIQDSLKQNKSMSFFSYVGIILIFVPAFSPILGGFLLESFGWRSIFYFITSATVLSFFLTFKMLEETNISISNKIDFKEILRSAKHIFFNKKFQEIALIYPFVSIGYWMFITGSAFIFYNTYHLKIPAYKYLAGLVIFSFALANLICRALIKRLKNLTIIKMGTLISLFGSLILYFFSGSLNPAFYVGGNMVFIFGLGLLFSPTTSLVLGMFPDNKGMSATIRSGYNMIASFLGAAISQGFSYNEGVFGKSFLVGVSLITLALVMKQTNRIEKQSAQ